MFNAMLASTEEGRELLESEMTQETIESKTFQEAFMRVAKMDQANGSDHTVEDLGNVMDDFNKKGTMAVLPNGDVYKRQNLRWAGGKASRYRSGACCDQPCRSFNSG